MIEASEKAIDLGIEDLGQAGDFRTDRGINSFPEEFKFETKETSEEVTKEDSKEESTESPKEKGETETGEEKEQELAKDGEKAPRFMVFLHEGKKYEVPVEAKGFVKVGGAKEEVTLDAIRNDYSGRTHFGRQAQETGELKRRAEEAIQLAEKKERELAIVLDKYTSGMLEGKYDELMYHAFKQAHPDKNPADLMAKMYDSMASWVEQYGNLSPEERRNRILKVENDAHERRHSETQKEEATRARMAELRTMVDGYATKIGATKDELERAEQALNQLYRSGQVTREQREIIEKGTDAQRVQLILSFDYQSRLVSTVANRIKEVAPELSEDNEALADIFNVAQRAQCQSKEELDEIIQLYAADSKPSPKKDSVESKQAERKDENTSSGTEIIRTGKAPGGDNEPEDLKPEAAGMF